MHVWPPITLGDGPIRYGSPSCIASADSFCNSQLTAISPKGFAVELKSIVRDEGMRYSEASDNVLLDKLLYVHISDIRQRLSFNLFGEIVRADQ